MSPITTIRVSLRTKSLLDELKHHRKESYEDVIARLVADAPCSDEQLSAQKTAGGEAGTGIEGGRQGKTTRPGRRSAYTPQNDTTGGVRESAGGSADAAIESRLSEILARLDRLEEEMHENVYPPESAIKPEFIRQVKKAEADIRKGKGKAYSTMDDFIRAIS
jgi:hypothetical protein